MSENPPPEKDPTQKMGKTMMYLSWLIGLGVLTWMFGLYEDNKNNPNQEPSYSSSGTVNEVRLKRNAYGHYVTTGLINGNEVTFLLDTGATHVSVPENLADDLGLEKMARARSSTANGYVDIFVTRIPELRIGNIVAHNVRANINPGMNHSDHVLLGMSVLKEVEFQQKGDTLVLRQAF